MKNLMIALLLMVSFNAYANTSITGDGIVSYVVDGDTMDIQTNRGNLNTLLSAGVVDKSHVNFSRNTFRVRLANIDTEESVHHNKNQNTQFGIETSNYVKNKIQGNRTQYECYRSGHYGRSICSLSFNGEDLGYHLIKNGYSTYLTSFGNHPTLHWQYRRAQAESIGSKTLDAVKQNDISNRVNEFRSRLFN